jgi:hypothetical protein
MESSIHSSKKHHRETVLDYLKDQAPELWILTSGDITDTSPARKGRTNKHRRRVVAGEGPNSESTEKEWIESASRASNL